MISPPLPDEASSPETVVAEAEPLARLGEPLFTCNALAAAGQDTTESLGPLARTHNDRGSGADDAYTDARRQSSDGATCTGINAMNSDQ